MKEYQGDSCILEKLCFRGTPRKEVLSLQDTLRCSSHMSTKVASLRILRPTRNFLQTHLQEPEFFFFCSRATRFVRDPSCHIKTPT